MSTDISKSDEVNESMFNMDEGEDDLLGQSIIHDLLDKNDGADVGGNQSDTQSATEKGPTVEVPTNTVLVPQILTAFRSQILSPPTVFSSPSDF